MPQFFVSTPLGAEATCLKEMKHFWNILLNKDARPQTEPFPEVKVHEGGLEFEADLFVAVQYNFFLKTANRILLRLDSFRVRDLPKFFNRVAEIPWHDYLRSADVEWEIAAQKSRLNNEKRLEESATAALLRKIPFVAANENSKQKVFIRVYDDLCTISLDTSGEHLHKRGWAVLKGEAPLRETLASFLLQELIGESPLSDSRPVHLLDPMCGSGTFLTEALTLFHGNYKRPYAFQQWVKGPKLFRLPLFSGNYNQDVPEVFSSYLGIDSSEKMIEASRKNWESLQNALKPHGLQKAPQASFAVADSLEEPIQAPQPLWMVLNPPYGERIANEDHSVPEVLEKLCINYSPERLGVLYPEKQVLKPLPLGYRLEKQVKLSNGGIRCLFSVMTRM